MSLSAIFANTPFDGVCQSIQVSPHVSTFKKQVKSSSWIVIFAMTPFDGKCQNQQMTRTHFCASSYRFRYIKKNCSPKIRSMAQRTIFANTPFDGKCQNVQMFLPHVQVLALTISEITIFQIFYRQKALQGHGMQFSQLH